MNQFTLNQNMICEQCVDGGQCFNGILYNQAGTADFKKDWFDFVHNK